MIPDKNLPHAKTERWLRQTRRWICKKRNSRIYLSCAVVPKSAVLQTPIFEWTCLIRSGNNMPYWWRSKWQTRNKLISYLKKKTAQRFEKKKKWEYASWRTSHLTRWSNYGKCLSGGMAFSGVPNSAKNDKPFSLLDCSAKVYERLPIFE